MRFLSLMLITCIITLSSMATVKVVPVKTNTADCCEKMSGKASCNNTSSTGQKKGCEKSGCDMMFTCCICGFIAVEQLRIASPTPLAIPDRISLFKTGNTSAYHFSDWKPPKDGK